MPNFLCLARYTHISRNANILQTPCYNATCMSRFVHLHTHSHYSLLNAVPTINEMVKAAKADGMEALALTDAGNLYGAVEFYQVCKKNEVKPIIGLDAYLAPRSRFDKEAGIDKPRERLVLLAKNHAGYKQLIKMVTASYVDGFYYRPRIDKELLTQHKDDLIAILPSFAGEHARALKNDDIEKAREVVRWYQQIFGDDLYFELTHHPEVAGHEDLQKDIEALGQRENVACVAAHDTYYLRPEDRRARETMIKIQTGGTVEDDTSEEDAEDFSFISSETAQEYFRTRPEALDNTIKIAEACNLEITLGHWYFPNYIIESGRAPDDEIHHLAIEGVAWRGLTYEGAVKERLDYELDVIKMKGYATYFLVVGDLLRAAREKGILTTIRGSVAGSLTTYVLGITTVNPLEYKIPFERFLNPERPSAPDVDMDYADNRRDEMIEYAKEKYGADKVAQIGTFGTMMARAAVRDTARALGHPYSVGDTVAKLIPMGSQGFPMTIDRAMELEKDLAELYKKDPVTRDVIDLAKKIEGKVRHISVHAAGVVIAPQSLTEFVPLQPDPKGGGKLITQYEMHAVGEDGVGLLKFDFLGIRNLSILADAIERVRKNKHVDLNVESIPIDDKKTFAMLARGETMGLFQLNGSGMTRFLKDLKPTTIHDINAMVALYRPGPMESIPTYIERKHNPHLIAYPDPRMKEFLEFSYGLLVYQDDVLITAIQLAGYSWLEADKLRKAMGKKIPEVMEAEKEKLLKGFREYGTLTPAKAEGLWKLIEPFAAYGFNKAHAASYGRVAYQTAYMKANFPVEYMAAIMTAESGDIEKVAEAVTECARMKIAVLPPDINESFGGFTVIEDDGKEAIRFGLYSIKNFGEGIADAIIEERTGQGKFASLSDFLKRIKNKNLNKKSLEALIKCGALDTMGERGAMLANIEYLLAFNKEHASEQAQVSLFDMLGGSELALSPAPEARRSERLAWEKELLGLYVSGHPLDDHKAKLERHGGSIAGLKAQAIPGTTIIVAGIIADCRIILTKKGEKMAFLKIADYEDAIEAVVFPKTFLQQKDHLVPETCIAVEGKLSNRNGEKSIIIEKLKRLS